MKTKCQKILVLFVTLILVFGLPSFLIGCGDGSGGKKKKVELVDPPPQTPGSSEDANVGEAGSGAGGGGVAEAGSGGGGSAAGSGALVCLQTLDCDGDGLINACDTNPNDVASVIPLSKRECDFDFNASNRQTEGDGYSDFRCSDYTMNADGTLDRRASSDVEHLSRTLCDNCIGIHNPTQSDADTDGAGDACDSVDDRNPVANPNPVSNPGSNPIPNGGSVQNPNVGVNTTNAVFVKGTIVSSRNGDGSLANPYASIKKAVESSPNKDIFVFAGNFRLENIEPVRIAGNIKIEGGYYCEGVDQVDPCRDISKLKRDYATKPTTLNAMSTALNAPLFDFVSGSQATLEGFTLFMGQTNAMPVLTINGASPLITHNTIVGEPLTNAQQSSYYAMKITNGSPRIIGNLIIVTPKAGMFVGGIFMEATRAGIFSPLIDENGIFVRGREIPQSSVGIVATTSLATALVVPVIQKSTIIIGEATQKAALQGGAYAIDIYRNVAYSGNEETLPTILDNELFVTHAQPSVGVFAHKTGVEVNRNQITILSSDQSGHRATAVAIEEGGQDLTRIFNNVLHLDLGVDRTESSGTYRGIESINGSLFAYNNTIMFSATQLHIMATKAARGIYVSVGTSPNSYRIEAINNILGTDSTWLRGKYMGFELVGANNITLRNNLFSDVTLGRHLGFDNNYLRVFRDIMDLESYSYCSNCQNNRALSDFGFAGQEDYQLAENSPGKDSGDNRVTAWFVGNDSVVRNYFGDRDLADFPRVINTTIDIGAYELFQAATAQVAISVFTISP